MSKERKSLLERGAEISKKVDIIAIGLGTVMVVSGVFPGLGVILVIGSAATYPIGVAVEQEAKKRRTKSARTQGGLFPVPA